jgi:hypothetical protein
MRPPTLNGAFALRALLLGSLLFPAAAPGQSAEENPPLRLHPENPRYFLFRGKPTVLVTSGEHYGAVMNLDFDYVPYLEELRSKGLNHTRTFSGAYREVPGSFGITDNTLAPAPHRYLCPWARSATPGYFDGGAKFDLTKWDEAYFHRLKDFVAQSGQRGIVVEITLFCVWYDGKVWDVSPMNARNNVNAIGNCPHAEVNTLKHKDLLAVQEGLVRKIVQELKDFDNLYYEICNEPYERSTTAPEWEDRIIATIVDAEAGFASRHLISRNFAHRAAKVRKPNPAVSIFNVHAGWPPDAVAMNYDLGRAIGNNETGGSRRDDASYRMEGWEFIIAGGALYSSLDFSFTHRHPAGTFLDHKGPGGGSPALRRQLQILKEFIHGFDFIRMAPAPEILKGGLPPGVRARALAERGRAYALYLHVPVGVGGFSVRWTGQVEPRFSETYTFAAPPGAGVRLWIDGQLLIDAWENPGTKELEGKISLQAGRKVDLRMECLQGPRATATSLSWSSPSQRREVVPRDRLSVPALGAPGLKGEYFEGPSLADPVLVRTDPGAAFNWPAKTRFGIDPNNLRADLRLHLPAGPYRAEWIGTKSGQVEASEEFDHPGGTRTLASPSFSEDIALRGVRR